MAMHLLCAAVQQKFQNQYFYSQLSLFHEDLPTMCTYRVKLEASLPKRTHTPKLLPTILKNTSIRVPIRASFSFQATHRRKLYPKL